MLIYLQMLESPEEKSILEQIYLEYRGLMYHVAYEILHNEQDAEDAVHHAFVKIAENIKKITDPVCPKTHSYVVTIVEHQGDTISVATDSTEVSDILETYQEHNNFRIYFPKIDDTSDGISVTCLDVVQYDSSGEIIQQAERQ